MTLLLDGADRGLPVGLVQFFGISDRKGLLYAVRLFNLHNRLCWKFIRITNRHWGLHYGDFGLDISFGQLNAEDGCSDLSESIT